VGLADPERDQVPHAVEWPAAYRLDGESQATYAAASEDCAADAGELGHPASGVLVDSRGRVHQLQLQPARGLLGLIVPQPGTATVRPTGEMLAPAQWLALCGETLRVYDPDALGELQGRADSMGAEDVPREMLRALRLALVRAPRASRDLRDPVAWPAALKFDVEHDVTFVTDRAEWDEDTDLTGYPEPGMLIDREGRVFRTVFEPVRGLWARATARAPGKTALEPTGQLLTPEQWLEACDSALRTYDPRGYKALQELLASPRSTDVPLEILRILRRSRWGPGSRTGRHAHRAGRIPG
jgi:hypothetical protein